MPKWADIEKTHGEMRNERAREEPRWRDIARFLSPDDQDLDPATDTRRDGGDVFDSTPLYAKEDFIGGMFSNAVNPAERWFELELEDTDLAEWGPVKRYLWQRASIIYKSLAPMSSGFYCDASPWFGDMGAFGTGWLAQEEWVGRGRIIERATPIGQIFKAQNAAGETCRVHNEFMFTGLQAKERWGAAAPAMRDEEKAKFVHAVYERQDYREGALGDRGKPFMSCYVSPDKRDFSVERGYYELPYHEVQWSRRSGRVWAKGPGHNALPDMRSNDEMSRLLQVALQFEAEPMLLVHDEDVMTAADVFPHNLIYSGLTADGKRMVERLDRGENLHLPMTEREQLRSAVQRGFKFGLWQMLKNRPQMTATEFLGFKEEDLKLLAPNLMPIQRGLATFIVRRDALLARMGAFDDLQPPPELVGQRISIGFESPFEKAQKSASARGTLTWWNALADLAVKTQDPSVLDPVKKDVAARKLHGAMVADPDVIADEREIAGIRQRRSEQQAQDVELARQAQQASIVADVAHAQQATTLSAGRKGRAA